MPAVMVGQAAFLRLFWLAGHVRPLGVLMLESPLFPDLSSNQSASNYAFITVQNNRQ